MTDPMALVRRLSEAALRDCERQYLDPDRDTDVSEDCIIFRSDEGGEDDDT